MSKWQYKVVAEETQKAEWTEAHSLERASQLASSFAGKKRTGAILSDL